MSTDPIRDYLHDVEPSGNARGRLGSSLAELCADVVGVTGAGIMLMIDGDHHGCLSASGATMETIENLQFTLGEGPCIDAFRSREAVIEPDLAHTSRWSLFSAPALDAGMAAVYAFPLLTTHGCVGAIDLYNSEPGDLQTGQLAEAHAIAGVVSDVILNLQADAESGEIPEAFATAIKARAVVHQAAGMTAAQLDVPVVDALVCLRAHAFALGQPVNDIAAQIVDRTLRLDGTIPRRPS
jgi:GAF domain-containing protein